MFSTPRLRPASTRPGSSCLAAMVARAFRDRRDRRSSLKVALIKSRISAAGVPLWQPTPATRFLGLSTSHHSGQGPSRKPTYTVGRSAPRAASRSGSRVNNPGYWARGPPQTLGPLPGQVVGPPQVAGEEAHRELARLVQHHHRGVQVLAAQEGGDAPHHDARGHDADQALPGPKGLLKNLGQAAEGFYFGASPGLSPGQPALRPGQRGADPKGQGRPPGRYGHYFNRPGRHGTHGKSSGHKVWSGP